MRLIFSKVLNTEQSWQIHRPIIISFIVAVGLMMVFFAISLSWMNDALERDSYNTIGQNVSSAFKTIVDENIHTMEAALLQMRDNPSFSAPFQNGNREELLALVQKAFDTLRKQHGITHLYFHKANRENFLRVHNPLEFGDQVNRHTLVEAQKRGELTSGIELGATNTLTLRVVGPWIIQNETIGFIEFGMEVQSFLKSIKDILHLDLAIFIDKKVLDRQAWEKGMSLLARSSDWQRYEEVVLSASTTLEAPPELQFHLYQNKNKVALINQENVPFLGFDHYHFVSMPIKNSSQRTIAKLVAIFNDTATESVIKNHLLALLLANLVTSVLVGFIFHRFLKYLESRLHQAGSELRHSEQRLRAILDTAMDAIIAIDTDSRILEFNPAAEKIFGFRKEDVLGKSLGQTIIPPEKWEQHSLGLARYLATGEKRMLNQHIEVTAMDIHGARIPTEISITVTKDKEFTFFTAYMRDITARKQMLTSLEDAISSSELANQGLREEVLRHEKTLSLLQASEERFRSVTMSIWDAIVAVDQTQKIIFWNRGAETLFGYTQEEALDNNLSMLIPARFEKSHTLGMQRCLSQRGHGPLVGQTTELTGVHKSGHEFPLELSLNSWMTSEGPYFSAIIRDITERKRTEETLLEAKESAEKANQAKSIFLAHMSHEIRTPMNTIIGMGYLLSQSLHEPVQRNQMQKIQNAAETLLGIIDNILDFSKIEAGRMVLERLPFDLFNIMEKISGMISQQAEQKGLEVVFALPAQLPHALIGDALRLEQILLNLCTNAIKFTHAGEVIIAIEAVENNAPNIKLRFSVRDTGIGLSEEEIGRLFQAFAQADSSTTRHYGGTGLGLAICKRLVEMMGGEISVSSKSGEGSEFVAIIPFEQQYPGCEGKSKASAIPALRVLVVDDNDCARHVLQSMVKDLGFECVTACSGESALLELEQTVGGQQKNYDIVLLDWRMPCLNGIETARHIKNHIQFAKPPVIVMVTAFGRQDVLEAAKDAGIEGIMLKPVTPSTLLDTIVSSHGGMELSDGETAVKASDQMNSTRNLQGVRILVVEDHEVNWQVMEGILHKAGALVTWAGNGQIALDLLIGGNKPFDCVLMDLQMPVVDGYDTTRILRHHFSKETLPIVAMTAHALKSERDKCMALGMNDYLTKPVHIKTLLASLAEVIGHKWPILNSLPTSPLVPVTEMNKVPKEAPLYGINRSEALDRIDGDEELLDRMLEIFANKYVSLEMEFTTAFSQGDRAAIRHLAHAVKGAAGAIAAGKVVELASHLESLSQRSELGECAEVAQQLNQETGRLVQDIFRHSFGSPQPILPPCQAMIQDKVVLKERLTELHTMLEDQDIGAREFFLDLKNSLEQHAGRELVTSMEQSLFKLEFAGAATTIAEILKSL
ncbi:MAG: PAS domain S-box protein [Magnetococcales bacterium]|nr:PAS domain S-box protein [Magnetococcales bacterium]